MVKYGPKEPYIPPNILVIRSFCTKINKIQVIFYLSLAFNILQIVLRCFLAYTSAQGGIAEVQKRRLVPLMFYLHLLLISCETCSYSLFIYLEAFDRNCLSEVSPTRFDCQYVTLLLTFLFNLQACFPLRFIFISGLALILISVTFFLSTFDSTGRVWRHHPELWCMGENTDSMKLNRDHAHRLIARLWRRRIRCLACLRNSCKRLDVDTKKHRLDAMILVSDLVGTYFMVDHFTLHIRHMLSFPIS